MALVSTSSKNYFFQKSHEGVFEKPTRPRIPAALRSLVWNTYIGEERGTFKCLCGSVVSQLNFECGHVISWSRGGATTLDNLRPVCSRCNKSMGTKNLFQYMTGMGLAPQNFYHFSKSYENFSEPLETLATSLITDLISSNISNLHKIPKNKKKVSETNGKWAITTLKTVGKGVWWTLGTSWWIMGKIIKLVLPSKSKKKSI